MSGSASGAVSEWRSYWPLPIAAGFGYSTAVLYTYGIGPFFIPLEQDFGWSRVEVSFGLFIAGLVGAILSAPVGILIDRVGPRVVGLVGVLAVTSAFALLGTATGTELNWVLLWLVVAFANVLVGSTVWTSAVATRFEKSRGFAFAITLSGASLSAAIFPLMGAWLISTYGWRIAFFTMGGAWAAIVFPVLVLFFRGGKDRASKWAQKDKQVKIQKEVVLDGLSFRQALKTPPFYKLMIAGGLYTFTTLAIVIHFVPVLVGSGHSPLASAGVASLIGVFAIVGRLGTGILLDHFSGNLIGGIVFILPVVSCALLLMTGLDLWAYSIAAIILGLTLGAEIDVIAYLATRHLGLRSFGVLFGAMVGAMALGISIGPLAAAAVHDRYGDYSYFLLLTILAMTVSSFALATLGPSRFGKNHNNNASADKP